MVAVTITLALLGCSREATDGSADLRFWAMGREGEVVQELVVEFEKLHPGIRVRVQQIPWTAAHEKLLTAHVGMSSPDLAQLGNTWISEFVTLRALEPLDQRVAESAVIEPKSYFPGFWDTNVADGALYGIPWYVDTRILFYRRDILAAAGFDSIPETWAGWRSAMEAVKARGGPDRYAIFLPINEWSQPVVFGLQCGSLLLSDHDSRGDFSGPEFRRAFDFYMSLYRDGLAPPIANTEIANVYQEFARGYFAMYITGPWNIGEFRRRIPVELQDSWATSPLPGPEGFNSGASLAGGSSLVVFRESKNKEAAFALIEYLSRPEQQIRFYHLTGDLPARLEAWSDSSLTADPHLRNFRRQLQHVVSTPKIPEWEQIAYRLQDKAELAIRGAATPESALASLDRDVDRMLEKRRWLLAQRVKDR
jgi:multiple sugar transport system substrate-binding protein